MEEHVPLTSSLCRHVPISFFYVMISDRKLKSAKAAFDVSVDQGITFFDTAEVYGSRVSNGPYFYSIFIH